MRDALDHCHAGGPGLCIVRWRLYSNELSALCSSRFVHADDAIHAGIRRKYRLFIQCGALFELPVVIGADLIVVVGVGVIIDVIVDVVIRAFDQASL